MSKKIEKEYKKVSIGKIGNGKRVVVDADGRKFTVRRENKLYYLDGPTGVLLTIDTSIKAIE